MAISSVIYSSFVIPGKTVGIVGMKSPPTSSFYYYLLIILSKKRMRPHIAKCSFHPHYPHCFYFLTKKDREDIGKQHEMTPGPPTAVRAIPTASPLQPHFLRVIPTAPPRPPAHPGDIGSPAHPGGGAGEASSGCKEGIVFL